MTAQHTCAGQVWRGWHYYICGKTAAHEHEGLRYCKTHHPPTVQAKRAQKQAEWEAKYQGKRNAENAEAEAKAEMKRRAECFPDLLEALQATTAWMERLRASGDAGNWEWSEGEEYSRGIAAIQKATNKEQA